MVTKSEEEAPPITESDEGALAITGSEEAAPAPALIGAEISKNADLAEVINKVSELIGDNVDASWSKIRDESSNLLDISREYFLIDRKLSEIQEEMKRIDCKIESLNSRKYLLKKAQLMREVKEKERDLAVKTTHAGNLEVWLQGPPPVDPSRSRLPQLRSDIEKLISEIKAAKEQLVEYETLDSSIDAEKANKTSCLVDFETALDQKRRMIAEIDNMEAILAVRMKQFDFDGNQATFLSSVDVAALTCMLGFIKSHKFRGLELSLTFTVGRTVKGNVCAKLAEVGRLPIVKKRGWYRVAYDGNVSALTDAEIRANGFKQ